MQASTAADGGSRPAHPVQLAAAGFALIAVSYGLARFAYGLFLPAFRSEFGLDATVVGAIAASSTLAYCVGAAVATVWTRRLGARVLAVAAGAFATTGMAVIAIAPDAGVLTAGVLIAGASTGLASPPLAHAVAHRVAPSSGDRVQAIVNAGTGAGVLLSGPVALVAHEQWRLAWVAFGAVAAAVTIWVALAVPSARHAAERAPAGDSPGRPAARAHLPIGSGRLLAAAAMVGASSAAIWTFGQELLTTSGGHSPGVAASAWIVLGASGLLGAAAGDIARRAGLRRAWLLAMLLLSVATAALAAAPQLLPLVLAASAVFGAVYIALTGLLLVWSTRVFTDRPARGVGLTFVAIALGQAGIAPALGAIADASSLVAAFWIAALLGLAASALRPPRALRAPDASASVQAPGARAR